MSHPTPTHDYGENQGSPKRNKKKSSFNDVIKTMNFINKGLYGVEPFKRSNTLLKKAGDSLRLHNKNHVEFLKRVVAKDRALRKKTDKKLPLTKRIDYYKNDPGYRDDQEQD